VENEVEVAVTYVLPIADPPVDPPHICVKSGWKTVLAPQVGAAGIEKRFCLICGEELASREIPPLKPGCFISLPDWLARFFTFFAPKDEQPNPRQEHENQISNGIIAEYGPETGLYGVPFVVTPADGKTTFPNFDMFGDWFPVAGYAWNIHFGETPPYPQPAEGTTVTLKIPLPGGYSPESLVLLHGWDMLEPVGTETVGGTVYVLFETGSFSEFVLLARNASCGSGCLSSLWSNSAFQWVIRYIFFGWAWQK